jgi:hypothetical protein
MASNLSPAVTPAVSPVLNPQTSTITNKTPVSWAGLLYLTLFLASKFSVAIAHTSAVTPSNLKKQSSLPIHKQESTLSSPTSYTDDAVVPLRYQNAAPPVYTLVFVLVPICAAIYITSTRFTDFRHFGFDMLFGTLIGVTCAWFSFRWYHLPVTRGAGWAWGPRSYERAWGIGVGRGSYVGSEGWNRAGASETRKRGMKGHHVGDESELGVLNRNGAPHAGNPPSSRHSRSEALQEV